MFLQELLQICAQEHVDSSVLQLGRTFLPRIGRLPSRICETGEALNARDGTVAEGFVDYAESQEDQ